MKKTGLLFSMVAMACGSPSSPDDGSLDLHSLSDAEFGVHLDQIAGEKTYAVSLGTAEILKPEGVDILVKGFLTAPLLMKVGNIGSSGVTFVGSMGQNVDDEIVQDPCVITNDFPLAAVDRELGFSFGPEDVQIEAQYLFVDILDFAMTGALLDDGSKIVNGTMHAWIDTRAIVPVAYANGVLEADHETAFCEFMEGFNIECGVCPGDEVEACFEVEIANLSADHVPSLNMQDVTARQVEAEPECDEEELEEE